eukprot:555649-Pelagomonas_calceolata.AAC.3
MTQDRSVFSFLPGNQVSQEVLQSMLHICLHASPELKPRGSRAETFYAITQLIEYEEVSMHKPYFRSLPSITP